MSLINEALKKAQRQRAGESSRPPMPTDGAPAQPSQQHKSVTARPLWLRVTLGTGVVAFTFVVGFGVWWFALRPPPAPPPAKPAAPAPAAKLAPENVAASARPSSEPAKTPLQTTPALAPSAPKETSPTAMAKAPEPPPAVTPAPLAPPSPPKQNPAAIIFIDGLHVSGIRAAGADSKVLMNDRVFRLNDVVDLKLDLKLTAVEAHSLTFVDERGVVYRKSF